jgi:hypothetical protein
MSETLTKLGFTEFKDNEARQDAFLTMIRESMESQSPAQLLGVPIGIPVIPLSSEIAASMADGFYGSDETPAEHKDRCPNFHPVVFEIMETIATTLDAPAAKSAAPFFVDPTEPLLPLIDYLEGLLSTEEIEEKLEEIMSRAPKLLKAMKEFPDDWEPLYDEIVLIKPGIDDEELRERLKELQDSFSFDLEGLEPPSIPIPTLPFLNVPPMVYPNFGIIAFFQKLVAALPTIVQETIDGILRSIDDFISAVAEGILAVIEFILNKIVQPIIDAVKPYFEGLFKMLGFVALISTILVFTVGMTLLTILGILIGTGMIAKGVQNLLGL